MDSYAALLAAIGTAVILTALVRGRLTSMPVSPPILYVGLGMALFAAPLGLEGPRPGRDDELAERLTEFVVIVSLMGAGLKLRRPVGLRSWSSTWRLLGITMPLTIAAVALLGGWALGLPAASAVLLGAVIAPTDPVLASDVQVPGPTVDGEEDDTADEEVRFALTSEAGLNDGLAFPFTNLAIAMAAGGAWFTGWIVEDVVVRLTVGVVVGILAGRAIGWLAFGAGSRSALARTSEGFVAIGATLAVYGVTELLHGYGFLAVFVAAVTIRNVERDHEYHVVLHDFAESTEHLASVVFLVLLGGAVVDGGLAATSLVGVLVAVAVVVVVRPVAGWLGLVGTRLPRAERLAIAVFGVRGMGSVYYLAHAATEERFPGAATVWAVTIAVVLVSIVLHGATAGRALTEIDRRRGAAAATR